MKLVFCLHCWDVFKLAPSKWRFCSCEKSFGRYLKDGLNAEYGGPCVPVGFANYSFADAVLWQPDQGMGYRFEAFVIPKDCPTMKRLTIHPKTKTDAETLPESVPALAPSDAQMSAEDKSLPSETRKKIVSSQVDPDDWEHA